MKKLIPFRRRRLELLDEPVDEIVREQCDACGETLVGTPHYARFRVCDHCRQHYPIGARPRLAALIDAGTFKESHEPLYSTDPLKFRDAEAYANRLTAAAAQRKLSDAIVTGSAEIRGVKVVVAALDFGFLGGSMGVVVGEKFSLATEQAIDQKRPLIAITASGGARMQEGMYSLLQMAKTVNAVEHLKDSGLPFISVLGHPTTGGVLASFASLGDLVIAEPDALIGFAGPRVVEQLLGSPLPEGSHTAEFQAHHGMIDAMVDRPNLSAYLEKVLKLMMPAQPEVSSPATATLSPNGSTESNAWEIVQACRSEHRPTTFDYVERVFDASIELHGDRQGQDDQAVLIGIAALGKASVVFAGFERGASENSESIRHGMPLASGFRKVQRAARLAEQLHLPFVTFIDTPGAYPGLESEKQGLAWEIAQTFATLMRLRTPTIALVIGEGGSGGALALGVTDRVLMQSGAFFSVISPEGAATILYRDSAKAPEIAEKLHITANDMIDIGFVDEMILEPPGGAAADVGAAADLLRLALMKSLSELQHKKLKSLLNDRARRTRNFGSDQISTTPPAHTDSESSTKPSHR